MRNIFVSAALMLGLCVAAPAAASPKPCRNAAGKIIECPKPKPQGTQRCKDASGKFVKCNAPGAKPTGGGSR